ncbi:hypothetical protein NT6N_24120 [Oceaniferula spumae]|uniref:Uncharacterized protein n=1 Tax=Oceaniferula spumae TaxID=2979115 RepID=A0AAT9FMM5_9BACT
MCANNAFCEDSRRIEAVRSLMVHHKWETSGVSFEESGSLVLIKRDGKVIGYNVNTSVWEPTPVSKMDLSKVTSIAYGYNRPNITDDWFTLKDKTIISVWSSVYLKHTQRERRYSHFVPISTDAGFTETNDEHQFGGGCMCSLALRFYAGEKIILELKGHMHKSSIIDFGMKNEVLHTLVKQRMMKINQSRRAMQSKVPDSEVNSSGEEPDPFADE